MAKMNLRPQERRLVVFVGIVFFVVLNIWLVWPHFGDWTKVSMDRERALRTLDKYRTEQSRIPVYKIKLRELESAGSSVIPEEQELDLVRTVDNQARLAGITPLQLDPRPKASSTTATNAFFEEQYVTLHATSDNEQLVKFLNNLTSTNSLIRVKDLVLKVADASQTRLDAQITLVASYQRRTPAKITPSTPSTPAPATKTTNVAKATNAAKTTNASPIRALTRTNRPPANASPGPLTNRSLPSRLKLTNAAAKK